MKLIDLTGQRFGRLTVIKKAKPYKSPDGLSHTTQWLCRCDCGKEVIVMGVNMKHGFTKSCGCLRSETSRKRLKAAYQALAQMKESEEEALGKSL